MIGFEIKCPFDTDIKCERMAGRDNIPSISVIVSSLNHVTYFQNLFWDNFKLREKL